MAGKPIDLSESSLRRLAVMMGENSAKQGRQPFKREPFGEREAERKSLHQKADQIADAERKKAARFEKELADIKREHRNESLKAKKAEEDISKKILDDEKKSKEIARESRIERMRARKSENEFIRLQSKKRAERLQQESKIHRNAAKASKDELKQIKATEKLRKASYASSIKGHIRRTKDVGSPREYQMRRLEGLGNAPNTTGLLRGISGKLGQMVAERGGAGGAAKAAGRIGGGALAGAGQAAGWALGGLGGTAGAIGGGIAGLAAGASPWGIAANLVKGTITAMVEADDKLLKMAGSWTKATGQIKASDEEAEKSLISLRDQFKDVYIDVIKQTAEMGVADEERIARINEMVKSFRPITKEGTLAGDTLTKLVEDSFRFQVAFNQSGDTITGAMTDAFRTFGTSAEKVSEQMASMYNTFKTGNEVFAKELGQNIIRMDEFSNIMFESARRGDLWSFNYSEVAKKLTTVAALASKAAMSEERRQKIAKGIIAFEQGGGAETDLSWLASKDMGEKYLKMSAEDVDKRTDLSDQAKEALKRVMSKKDKYEDITLFGAHIMEALSGTQEASKAKKDQLQKILAGVQGEFGKIETAKQFLEQEGKGVQDLSKLDIQFVMDEYLNGTGGVQDAMKRLQAAKASKAQDLGATSQLQAMKATTQGAVKTEFAARGIIESSKNMVESMFHASKAAHLAGNAFEVVTDLVDRFGEALGAALGDDDFVKQMKFRRQKKLSEYKDMPQNIKQVSEKYGVSPADAMGVMKEGYEPAALREKLKKKGMEGAMVEELVQANKENQAETVRQIKEDTSKDLLGKYEEMRRQGLSEPAAYSRLGELPGVGGIRGAKTIIEQLQEERRQQEEAANPTLFGTLKSMFSADGTVGTGKTINELEVARKRQELRQRQAQTIDPNGTAVVDAKKGTLTIPTRIENLGDAIANESNNGANQNSSIPTVAP